MQKTFEVMNVKCSGCAATLKGKLFEKFGEVEVDLNKEPREITLNIEEEEIEELSKELKRLGYPLSSDSMGFVESTSVKAKSYVSCAIGKMNK
ncbi:MAG: heavy metal transporter [Sulfurovum sp.]|jgi:copper chaperone CopZ|uniref:heavy-metal-associated domain-containing protein n=1 Tax=Sulfurovum sp. TaxID=1969726 RepID=UPI003C74EEC1